MHSDVPVINALSDKYHPLQTLADLMALRDHFKGSLKGKTLSWVGDGNNVLHDLMVGSMMQGMHVRVATPVGYDPDSAIVQKAKQLAKANKVTLTMTRDPIESVSGADVIVTDTWIRFV